MKRILLIITLAWMAMIFAMSARNADLSGRDSSRVGMAIGRIFVRDFDSLLPEEQEAFAEDIDFVVRKTAHATEYAVLGLLLMLNCACYSLKLRSCCWRAWMIASIYAVTDEVHQYFVPGRSCQVRDVLIDSIGAFAGCIIVVVIMHIIKERNGF